MELLLALFVIVLDLPASSDTVKSQRLPNPTSRSTSHHSHAAREALQKAEWRCKVCRMDGSQVFQTPLLHIKELPSPEYVGGEHGYSKFRILCPRCHSDGRKNYRWPTANGAAPKSATPRKALSASLRASVFAGASHIPHGGLHHPRRLPEASLSPPEAPRREVACLDDCCIVP